MKVDWDAKHMTVSDRGWRMQLQGIRLSDANCRTISAMQCLQLLKQGSVTQVIQVYAFSSQPENETEDDSPEDVQKVLGQFAAVFAEPSGQPPRCECDHKIDRS